MRPPPLSPALLLAAGCLLLGMGRAEEKRKPPVITEPVRAETVSRAPGTNFTLSCEANGIPQPRYTWQWRGTEVSGVNPPDNKVRYNAETGQLTISDLQKGQTGPYRCLATTRFSLQDSATAMSHTTTVILATVGNWPQTEREPVKGKEGDYLKIACDDQLPVVSGPVTFKWYRRSTDGESVTDGPRIFIDQEGALHFNYVVPEDDEGDLPYSCGILSDPVGTIKMGAKIDLQVERRVPSGIPTTKPTLRFSSRMAGPEELTFRLGEVAKLQCFFSGYPTPNTVWKDKNLDTIETGGRYTLSNSGRQLTIDGVKQEDEDNIYCYGVQGSTTSPEETMRLNITSAPIMVEGPGTLTVLQGQDAVFRCHARSMRGELPPGTPTWFRNGEILSNNYDPRKLQFSDGQKTLTVTDVQKGTDIACFQCLVSNSEGETLGQGCLNVILPIRILFSPEPEQTVAQGDVVNLTVVATTDPLFKLKYEWIFKNRTYNSSSSPPPFVTYEPLTGVAFINTSGLSDKQMSELAGLYRRKVYHAFQTVMVDVDVRLEKEPHPVAAGFQWWIIGVIFAILLILIVIIICCCVICRRKMQEGDYPVDKKETEAGLDPAKEMKDSVFPDLSRAVDPNQNVKPGPQDMDGRSLRDDESFGSTEYGEEPTAFNEDGSFIGQYSSKVKDQDKQAVDNPAFQPFPPLGSRPPYHHSNESAV